MSSQKPSGSDSNGPTDTPTASAKDSSDVKVPKAIIKNVDMSDEMQQISVDIALEALNKFTVEKDIAAHVKKTMDIRFGPTWHAVVGQKYGSYVTHGEKQESDQSNH
jgi:dynein light chain LC8-type